MFRRKVANQKYYSNRANEFRARRSFNNRIIILRAIVAKILFVALAAGMFYALFFTPILSIKDIQVEGNLIVNSDDIKSVVLSVASKKSWKIFQNNNLLLFDQNEAKKEIENGFPSIESLEIKKQFPDKIIINIKEKPADIAWCNALKIEKINNDKKTENENVFDLEIPQCYLSDEKGIIYEKISEIKDSGPVKVYRDEPIEIGSSTADDNVKNFIRTVTSEFNSKTGLKISYLYMLPASSRELHLFTDRGWKIYFDLNRSASDEISDLSAFIKAELKNNDGKNADYDYIDLRIIDRIIVKQKTVSKQ